MIICNCTWITKLLLTNTIYNTNAQATLALMQKMILEGMASSYEAILDLPADKHPITNECIATLIDAEL